MNEADKARVLEVLAGVHDFYGKDMSEFAADVWLQAVAGFEAEQVTKALSAHLMDPDRGQFMPKPADLVRQLHGTAADRSLIAWGKVLDAIKRVGAYQSVAFDDGAIHAVVVDLGGWPKLCRTTEDELPFVQRRFCEAHRAYSSRGEFVYPAKLIGESEQVNAARGYASAPPLLVGDPKRAQLVLKNGSTVGKTAITALDSLPAHLRLGVNK